MKLNSLWCTQDQMSKVQEGTWLSVLQDRTKCKHCLLFQLFMRRAEKADLELWLQGCSVVDLYQLRYCSASLPATGNTVWRCQPQASNFITSNGTTAASSGHCRTPHLMEKTLSNIMQSQLVKRCQKSAESSHSLPINVDGRLPWTCKDTIFLQTPASPVADFMLRR